MKKARLADGQIVLAHQFNKAVHEGQLFCADPNCTAHMVFRKETLTHGASAIRSASFVSKSVKDHVYVNGEGATVHCNAHEDFAIVARAKKNIEQALKDDKMTIVINLNMALTEDTKNLPRDLVCVPATYKRGTYVTASAKSVEDVLEYMQTIEEKGGQAGLDKTVVNYKGTTMPIKDFVIDSDDKYRDLLNKLYVKVDKARPEAELADFPRLIEFRATRRTRELEAGAVRGTPVPIVKAQGNKVILLQVADIPPEFQTTLRGENVRLVAIPKIDLSEAKRILKILRETEGSKSFLQMHWKVVGSHQFTPVEEPAPEQKPQPKPGQQTMFGL